MLHELLRDLRAARHLEKTRHLLAEVYSPAGVRIWMTSRNRHLGGHTPLEFILDGFGDLVVAEAERLVSS